MSQRRTFLKALTAGATGSLLAALTNADERPAVTGKIGLTTGSFMRHLSPEARPGKVRLLDIPKIMRDELGLKVLDLMTACFASFKPAYLDDLRNRADKAGLLITNLKMNQRGLDMANADDAIRQRAIDEYKKSIDVAERLGCRWVRPLPGPKRPESQLYVDSYRRLIDYAEPKGISLLIENFGWMQDDPDAIPTVMKAVGKGLAASVDTGNWTNAARYAGLEKAFPQAVTCDFKAFQFDEDGKHPRYDLERCFRIGWDAGFRGPWCFEHFNETLDGLLKGLVQLREMLTTWGVAG